MILKNKRNNLIFKATTIFIIVLIVLAIVFYGPYEFIRETWITSAMTTLEHQWLATSIYDAKTINEILQKHSYVAPKERTNADLTIIKYDGSDKIELIDVSTNNFRAYLMKIYDPKRVKLVPCKNLGEQGQKIKDILSENNAIAGINGSGFMDTNGHTKGGVPSGLIMSNKKIIYSDNSSNISLVGLNEDNKLILGFYTMKEILKSNIRDAVSFAPLLIINGIPTIINGNGGWGIAPRTAIGQTKDGAILLLVIDGRQLSSFGATVKDVQDIFIKYGAFNAANLDGGSSSIMMYENETVNFPCTSKTGRYIPSAFIVTK